MEQKTALIVDDEQDVLEHVGSMLRSSGFEVIAAATGKDAIREAVEKKPDIIILDVFLPDIDGGEVAHRLSLGPNTQDIPVIFLTGLVTKDEKQAPDRTGKNFVMAKPVLKQELLSLINQILQ